MPHIDINDSKARFIEKLKGGVYTVERSQNNEAVYAAEKEERDTEAVKAFLSSDLAKEIMGMK